MKDNACVCACVYVCVPLAIINYQSRHWYTMDSENAHFRAILSYLDSNFHFFTFNNFHFSRKNKFNILKCKKYIIPMISV